MIVNMLMDNINQYIFFIICINLSYNRLFLIFDMLMDCYLNRVFRHHFCIINTLLAFTDSNYNYIVYISMVTLYYFLNYINMDLENIQIYLDITFYIYKNWLNFIIKQYQYFDTNQLTLTRVFESKIILYRRYRRLIPLKKESSQYESILLNKWFK